MRNQDVRHARWNPDAITGMWKFAPGVDPQILATLAREWKDSAPDRYSDLHVRSWGRNQFAICFTYRSASSYPMRLYIKNIRDIIQSHLSSFHLEKELIGWDITQGAWYID